jgi:hypothetical protein
MFFQLLHKEKTYLKHLKEMIEQTDKIPSGKPGMLEIPEGKEVEDMSLDHFTGLVKKNGFDKISKALINLRVWNKEKNPDLSRWADKMQEKVDIWVQKERVKSGDSKLYEK